MLDSLTIVLAQAGRGPQAAPDAGAGMAALLFSCCCPLLFVLLLAGPQLAGMWKAFEKARQPGWAALVPIYNIYILCKIAGKEDTRFIFWLIPIANIYFSIVDTIDFCKAYGKDVGFAIGMILLPVVFWPILGFGGAVYKGAPDQFGRARPYEEGEPGEEEERPRRRQRPRDEEEY